MEGSPRLAESGSMGQIFPCFQHRNAESSNMGVTRTKLGRFCDLHLAEVEMRHPHVLFLGKMDGYPW